MHRKAGCPANLKQLVSLDNVNKLPIWIKSSNASYDLAMVTWTFDLQNLMRQTVSSVVPKGYVSLTKFDQDPIEKMHTNKFWKKEHGAFQYACKLLTSGTRKSVSTPAQPVWEFCKNTVAIRNRYYTITGLHVMCRYLHSFSSFRDMLGQMCIPITSCTAAHPPHSSSPLLLPASPRHVAPCLKLDQKGVYIR